MAILTASLGLVATLLSPAYAEEEEPVVGAPISAVVDSPMFSSGVVINPTGGSTDGDGLYILFNAGSFKAFRNNQLQVYQIESNFNGILLNVGASRFVSPFYDYVGTLNGSFLKVVDLGGGVTNTVTGTQSDVFVAESFLYTDLNDNNTFDLLTEVRIRVQIEYEHPNEYFSVFYSLDVPASNTSPIQLYHGVDMMLDGSDSGPVLSGTGIGDFNGRYALQLNPLTGAVGGIIERPSYSWTSFFADSFGYIVNPDSAEWVAPLRGPDFGEPFPNTVTDDPATDVGVGLHFDLGTPFAYVEKSSYFIFASGLPSSEEQEPEPINGLNILSKGEMAVTCGDTSREVSGEVEDITSVKVGGVAVPFEIHTGGRMTIDLSNAPTGIQNLEIQADKGSVVWQRAYDISACSAVKAWTSFNEQSNLVRIYAKNIIGQGKIQFFVDGREVGWVTPVDASDPKLITNSNGVYFVRTVKLDAMVKNRIEIKLKGERLVFNTYVPKD